MFAATMIVTLATDVLIGVALGLVITVALYLKNGARLTTVFKAIVEEERVGDELLLLVHEAAISTNYAGLKNRLPSVDETVKVVIIDFENAWAVDHTVLDKNHGIARSWAGRRLIMTGLTDHKLAARRKVRPAVAV